jgi:hypothetical protein
MLKSLLGFLVGFVSASALFILVIVPKDGRDKFQYGYHNGMVEAQFDMARRIPSVLGNDLHLADLPISTNSNVFLQVKDATILVVERNGVKTLRDYDNVPKDKSVKSLHLTRVDAGCLLSQSPVAEL